MALEDPTNCWTHAEDGVATTLSQLQRLRTWQGGLTESQSLDEIDFEQASDMLEGDIPWDSRDVWVTVWGPADQAFVLSPEPSHMNRPSGTVIVSFIAPISPVDFNFGSDLNEVSRFIKNRVGDIAILLWDALRHNGVLSPRQIYCTSPRINSRAAHQDENTGVLCSADIVIEWGR